MQVMPRAGNAVNQTARSATVNRVVLQDLAHAGGLEYLIQRDTLVHHLLVRVLSDAQVLCCCLGVDSIRDTVHVGWVRCLSHWSVRFLSKCLSVSSNLHTLLNPNLVSLR